MSRRPDIAEVKALLAERMPDLARELCGEPTDRARQEHRYRRKGSLAVVVAGQTRGSGYDHEAGQGGDALGLVAHMHGTQMRPAWEWALRWLGVDTDHRQPFARPRPAAPPPPEQPPEPGRTDDMARQIWASAQPAAGSMVETYLASRGLTLPAGAPIRFHPACQRGAERLPAMVALMTSPQSAEGTGVHRTFLAPDGRGKAAGQAKMMAGKAGVIRLAAAAPSRLGLAEGIETALAVSQRGGWAPMWAATSSGAIRGFPVLPGIAELHVFADADKAGIDAARQCGRRWVAAGRKARAIWPPAGDWDDALRRNEGVA